MRGKGCAQGSRVICPGYLPISSGPNAPDIGIGPDDTSLRLVRGIWPGIQGRYPGHRPNFCIVLFLFLFCFCCVVWCGVVFFLSCFFLFRGVVWRGVWCVVSCCVLLPCVVLCCTTQHNTTQHEISVFLCCRGVDGGGRGGIFRLCVGPALTHIGRGEGGGGFFTSVLAG